jgi:hypothetical protein
VPLAPSAFDRVIRDEPEYNEMALDPSSRELESVRRALAAM